MQSTKHQRITPKDKYPCLKVSVTGRVVLFSSYECGTLVHDPAGICYQLGDHSEVWHEDEFTTYHGTITLEN